MRPREAEPALGPEERARCLIPYLGVSGRLYSRNESVQELRLELEAAGIDPRWPPERFREWVEAGE
jgi:hypothetical protein